MSHPAGAETLRVDRELRIPAGTGAGLRMAAGEDIQIIDVEGRGCADSFALAVANPAEHLAASHARVQIDRLFPQVGPSFFSSFRRPMQQFERTAPRASTTCCSPPAIRRYAQYHVPGECVVRRELLPGAPGPRRELSRRLPAGELVINVAVRPDGSVTFGPPQTEASDWVLLRGLPGRDLGVPQQWNPATNYPPSDLLARILTR